MNARSLQEDLLSIPGVEGAEVEGSADRPAGLRIRIAEGADQRAVGGAIRRVLTSHGLGTDTRLPGEAVPEGTSEPTISSVASPPEEAAESEVEVEAAASPSSIAVAASEPVAVIDLTGEEPAAAEDAMDIADEALDDPDTAGDEPAGGRIHPDDVVMATPPEIPEDVTGDAVAASPVIEDPAPPSQVDAPDSVPEGRVPRLASVAVEEGRGGIVVTVATSDGSQLRQAAASNEGGVETAVVLATAQLAMPEAPAPTVIEIEDRRVEGVDIVMIVLDVDGRKAAGSAVVGAGRAFALARATWAALSM